MLPVFIAVALFISLPAFAQKGSVVDMPKFTYTDNDPGKYKWQHVCTVHDRIIFDNSITCTDSLIYCFGGFSSITEMAQREMNVLVNGKFRKANIRYPGEGFMSNLVFHQDSLLFIGGGVDSNKANYCATDLWQYNLNTRAWNRLKDLPFYYRHWQSVFEEDGKVIALIPQLSGDKFRKTTYRFYVYDIAADQWTPIESTNEIPEISAGIAFKIGDNAFVFSQAMQQSGGPVNVFYKFSFTTRSWSILPAFPGPARILAFACSDGRYGYIGGGVLGTSDINAKDVYRYDRANSKWERCTDLPLGVRWAKGWHFKDAIYIGFGITSHENTMQIWKLRQRKSP